MIKGERKLYTQYVKENICWIYLNINKYKNDFFIKCCFNLFKQKRSSKK